MLKRLAIEIIIVAGEKLDRGGELQRQRPHFLGYTDLWFEKPPICTHIQQLVLIILTQGGRHLQTNPHY